MKQFKIALAVALAAVATFAFTSKVSADELEQGQAQSANCRYTSNGAYGQDVELVCELDQAQYQRAEYNNDVIVRYVDGEVVYLQPHQVADTALDLQSALAAAGTIVTGATATAIKVINKNRVA